MPTKNKDLDFKVEKIDMIEPESLESKIKKGGNKVNQFIDKLFPGIGAARQSIVKRDTQPFKDWLSQRGEDLKPETPEEMGDLALGFIPIGSVAGKGKAVKKAVGEIKVPKKLERFKDLIIKEDFTKIKGIDPDKIKSVKVFGSSVEGKARPGDIDVFVKVSDDAAKFKKKGGLPLPKRFDRGKFSYLVMPESSADDLLDAMLYTGRKDADRLYSGKAVNIPKKLWKPQGGVKKAPQEGVTFKELDQMEKAGVKTEKEAKEFLNKLRNPVREIDKPEKMFHGTSSGEFNKFKGDVAYLTKNKSEAKAFADSPILGGGRGKGNPRVLEVEIPRGKIKDIDEIVQEAVVDGKNLDEVIKRSAKDARSEGFEYLSFKHPSSVDGLASDFDAIISVNPSKLKIDNSINSLVKEARKHKSFQDFINKQDVYTHQTNTKFDDFDVKFSHKDDPAIWFYKGKAPKSDFKYTMNRYPKKDIKLIKEANLDKFMRESPNDMEFYKYLESRGYDGIEYADDTIQIFNPQKSLMNESQIKDIFIRAKGNTLPKFEGLKDLSTNIVERLKGRDKVSKQFISDLTNTQGVKQPEKELIRNIIEEYPNGDIPVKEFANKVRSSLIPLKETRTIGRYESVNLPDKLRGKVKNYGEKVYEGPVNTTAGSIHFRNDGFPKYFAHVRYEELPKGSTRRILEMQSDLFQKGFINERIRQLKDFAKGNKTFEDKFRKTINDLENLKVYKNNWNERIIKEEVRQAAIDGKKRLRLPTGETAMKIEGIGRGIDEGRVWTRVKDGSDIFPQDYSKLKVGERLGNQADGQEWIITDILGDGKFKAVPRGTMDKLKKQPKDLYKTYIETLSESFDVSGKIDKSNPIYKFYEKDIGNYLRNKYNTKRIKDPQGVEWWEIQIDKGMSKKPVEAFGLLTGIETMRQRSQSSKKQNE